MSDSKLSVCSECGSKYIAASSKMKAMCPECASILYGYENCDHVFKDGRCIKCFWDRSRSVYIQRIVGGRSDKMDLFRDKYTAFQKEFGLGRKMVLSTSENSRVSSRMMSVIHINGEFYFQTDITMKKYHQITANNNVALCIDNIQIEGKCLELGHPLDYAQFCAAFQECFKGSYDAFTALENERLFVVIPHYIERWIYKEGVPYNEFFDIEKQEYSCRQYSGK